MQKLDQALVGDVGAPPGIPCIDLITLTRCPRIQKNRRRRFAVTGKSKTACAGVRISRSMKMHRASPVALIMHRKSEYPEEDRNDFFAAESYEARLLVS
jgi:hypothetical protein